MRWTTLDGGVVGFDRTTGLNVLVANERTRGLARAAPRSIQVALLTPCNLSCSFCYRDREAPSLLKRDFVVELLQKAERWGVLEVAFGGGEPLLFKGFVEMIDELHRTTSLGLNVTTNGVFLTPEIMDGLTGKIAEFRLSIYPDNDWAGTLERHREANIGVNLLVTPANVAGLAPRVRDLFRRGAKNVLLLGYKGADPSLLLGPASLASLERAALELVDGDGLPILLDICLYPLFPHLPHLFRRSDCGSGDDILGITADRAVQACSFADRRIPFSSFEDLKAIYGMLRATKPHANVAGCTRGSFSDGTKTEVQRVISGRILPMLDADTSAKGWAWKAHASSNSGAYTLLARFKDVAAAKKLESMLDDAYQAHLDFIVDDKTRLQGGGDTYYAPTPPLVELGRAHGFEWPRDGGFAWEGDTLGDRAEADALTIERFGSNVLVHIGYGQQIGEAGIEHLCALLGAERVVGVEMPFRVIVTPKTSSAEEKVADAIADAQEDDMGHARFDSDRDAEGAFQDYAHQVEVHGPAAVRQLGFSSYATASKLVVDLAGIKDVDFDLRGGRAPQRVERASTAYTQPTEPLDASGETKGRRFELSEGTSNKFWEVEVQGTKLTTRFGRIGAKAQASEKSFATPEAAAKEAQKLIAEKTKKGYAEKA